MEMSELEIGCVTDEGPHGLRDKGHDGTSASETCPGVGQGTISEHGVAIVVVVVIVVSDV